jgi:hypothetical protein
VADYEPLLILPMQRSPLWLISDESRDSYGELKLFGHKPYKDQDQIELSLP